MASHRVLVADPISEHGVALLNEHPDITADFIPDLGSQPEKLLEIIGDYDALIVRSQTKPNAEVIARGSRLRAIGRAGVGVDNIDREAASAHGVIVMNTPTGNTVSTAEHAFALMLATARNIAPAHAEVLKGEFKSARKAFAGVELNGKRLAVIGMGRIGSEFVKRAQGFNMKVVAFDPFLTQARADELKVELADSPDAVLKGADVVTLHVPLTDDTRHIINTQRLALMNKGALVINCARGGLIDEKALRDSIDSGHIAGCALDVYEDEPPSPDHPLFSCSKHVAFTPHLGASTAEAQENVGIQVAEQIRDFLTTGEILIPEFSINGRESGQALKQLAKPSKARLKVGIEWTYPLSRMVVVSGDGKTIYRDRIEMSDTQEFGERDIDLKVDLSGRNWLRVEIWDIANNGAFTQPIWIE